MGGWRWERKTRRQRETQRLEDDKQGREDRVWRATGSQHAALQRGEGGGRGRGDPVHPAPPGSWPRGATPRSASRGSYLPGCGCAGRCSQFTEQKKQKCGLCLPDTDRAPLPLAETAGLTSCSTGPVSPSRQILLFTPLSENSARPLPHITATAEPAHMQL